MAGAGAVVGVVGVVGVIWTGRRAIVIMDSSQILSSAVMIYRSGDGLRISKV